MWNTRVSRDAARVKCWQFGIRCRVAANHASPGPDLVPRRFESGLPRRGSSVRGDAHTRFGRPEVLRRLLRHRFHGGLPARPVWRNAKSCLLLAAFAIAVTTAKRRSRYSGSDVVCNAARKSRGSTVFPGLPGSFARGVVRGRQISRSVRVPRQDISHLRLTPEILYTSLRATRIQGFGGAAPCLTASRSPVPARACGPCA